MLSMTVNWSLDELQRGAITCLGGSSVGDAHGYSYECAVQRMTSSFRCLRVKWKERFISSGRPRAIDTPRSRDNADCA